jgi:hypothetical protein
MHSREGKSSQVHAKKLQIPVAESIVNAIAGLAPFGRGFSRSQVRVLGMVLAAAGTLRKRRRSAHA